MSDIKFVQGEETRFHYMHIQFAASLDARAKQIKTIAIQPYKKNDTSCYLLTSV
jgi:hypothetical protein